MKLTVTAIFLLIALCSAGCTSTVARATLMHRVTRRGLTLWPDTTYYCGSKRGFDYFFIQPSGPAFRRSHSLRVRQRENVVTDRFEYTTDRTRWIVFVGLNREERDPEADRPAGTPMAPAEQVRR